MVKDGVIEKYAIIGGAVAAIFYIEPFNTNDLAIFFHLKEESAGLDILKPLYEYLSKLGYTGKRKPWKLEAGPFSFFRSSILS